MIMIMLSKLHVYIMVSP